MKQLFVFIAFVLAFNCNAQIIQTKSSCDSNGDGTVSIEDVTNTINKVMGAIAEEREVVDAAGLNSLLLSLDSRLAAIEKEIGIMPGSAKYEEIVIDGKTYKLGISGAIDLGLSVKWAAFNVGATAPAEYGDYFAWGETEPYYAEGNSQTSPCTSWRTGKSGYNWDSYFDSSFSVYATDKKTDLASEHDVAQTKWRGAWRMPTKEEFNELEQKAHWFEKQYKGINGWYITGDNGNAIFLPAAGFRYYRGLYFPGESTHYWTSTLGSSTKNNIAESYDNGESVLGFSDGVRYYGQSIRPVCE